MALEDIVNVSITRQTTVVSRAGFGTVLIVGDNPTFSGRVQYYGTDLAALAADLTGGTTDPEYLAAATLMSQNPKPIRVALGRVDIGDADMTASLVAMKAESNDWYGFLNTTRTSADDEDCCDWSELNEKLFGIAADDANIIDQAYGVDTTSIAAYIQDNNLARSFAFYSAEADGTATDSFPEAGVFGQFVTRDPGSYTVMFKTPAGFVADDLSTTQVTNALAKNCNIFHAVGGVDILQDGKVGEGEYIDVIVFVDWLKARLTEDIYAILVNLPKVPYTDSGINAMDAAIKKRLQIGVDKGGLTDNPAFVVVVPDSADVSSADKAARILNDVTFTGYLAGAIHAVTVTGVVTL